MFSKTKQFIDNILIYTSMLLVSIMLFCVCWQVFSRYFLQIPSTFTEELVRFLLIWIGFLGAAYSFGKHKHLSLSLIKDKIPIYGQKFLSFIIIIIVLFVSIFLLIFGGIKLMIITWNQNSAILQIPMGYIYSILPITGLIIVFYKSYDLYKLLIRNNK